MKEPLENIRRFHASPFTSYPLVKDDTVQSNYILQLDKNTNLPQITVIFEDDETVESIKDELLKIDPDVLKFMKFEGNQITLLNSDGKKGVYFAKNGELTIAFGSEAFRKKCCELMGLDQFDSIPDTPPQTLYLTENAISQLIIDKAIAKIEEYSKSSANSYIWAAHKVLTSSSQSFLTKFRILSALINNEEKKFDDMLSSEIKQVINPKQTQFIDQKGSGVRRVFNVLDEVIKEEKEEQIQTERMVKEQLEQSMLTPEDTHFVVIDEMPGTTPTYLTEEDAPQTEKTITNSEITYQMMKGNKPVDGYYMVHDYMKNITRLEIVYPSDYVADWFMNKLLDIDPSAGEYIKKDGNKIMICQFTGALYNANKIQDQGGPSKVGDEFGITFSPDKIDPICKLLKLDQFASYPVDTKSGGRYYNKNRMYLHSSVLPNSWINNAIQTIHEHYNMVLEDGTKFADDDAHAASNRYVWAVLQILKGQYPLDIKTRALATLMTSESLAHLATSELFGEVPTGLIPAISSYLNAVSSGANGFNRDLAESLNLMTPPFFKEVIKQMEENDPNTEIFQILDELLIDAPSPENIRHALTINWLEDLAQIETHQVQDSFPQIAPPLPQRKGKPLQENAESPLIPKTPQDEKEATNLKPALPARGTKPPVKTLKKHEELGPLQGLLGIFSKTQKPSQMPAPVEILWVLNQDEQLAQQGKKVALCKYVDINQAKKFAEQWPVTTKGDPEANYPKITTEQEGTKKIYVVIMGDDRLAAYKGCTGEQRKMLDQIMKDRPAETKFTP